jgi:3-hydroxyisobutyrate dehydrogenase-like beta-hydroxyacid dehydrogenase
MPRKSRKNVGVIGLGIIGSRVVTALRASGYHVYVWNRSPRVVPNFLASPAEVAEVCDIIQILVSDAQALFEVIDGFGDQLTPRHTIICNATVGPEATLEAAKLVEESGAQFLDAPFTGSKLAAEKRELVYYVGGSDETLDRAEQVLRASGRSIVKIGKIGQAATIKIATNMLAAVTVQTLAEALAIVKRSGIPPEALVDAVENHAVRSGLMEIKLPRMVQGDFEPHFSMKHMFKDVQLAIHVANSLDIDIPATTATAGVMYGGLNRGWADMDFSALAKIYTTDDEAIEEETADIEESEQSKPTLEETSAAPEGASVEEAPSGPPRESLSHMIPPPPREELAAALETKLGETSDLPRAALDEQKKDENAALPESDAVPKTAEIGENHATPLNARSAEPAGQDAAAKVGSDNESEPAAAAKPAEPRPAPPNNPIRRWFVARGQSRR